MEAAGSLQVPDPVMQLACLDASLAMRPVFAKYQVGSGSCLDSRQGASTACTVCSTAAYALDLNETPKGCVRLQEPLRIYVQ